MAEATLIRGDEPQNSLLVQGTDDEHMFYSLLVYHRIPKRFKIKNKKALLHTWLAWQAEPGKPIGQAITANYLDANAMPAQQLMKWIRHLFDLEVT